MLKKLNFPDYQFKIQCIGNKFRIFDELRKKYVRLTDEEWVRQHMIRFMINEQKIPAGLIKVESGLKYEKVRKRTDIMVYNRDGTPFLLIECKSPLIKMGDQVLFQAGLYGKSLQASYIGITNGLQHYFWVVDYQRGETSGLAHFPEFN